MRNRHLSRPLTFIGDFVAHFHGSGRADGLLGLLQSCRPIVLACLFGQIVEQAFARTVELINQRVLFAPTAGPGTDPSTEG